MNHPVLAPIGNDRYGCRSLLDNTQGGLLRDRAQLHGAPTPRAPRMRFQIQQSTRHSMRHDGRKTCNFGLLVLQKSNGDGPRNPKLDIDLRIGPRLLVRGLELDCAHFRQRKDRAACQAMPGVPIRCTTVHEQADTGLIPLKLDTAEDKELTLERGKDCT